MTLNTTTSEAIITNILLLVYFMSCDVMLAEFWLNSYVDYFFLINNFLHSILMFTVDFFKKQNCIHVLNSNFNTELIQCVYGC